MTDSKLPLPRRLLRVSEPLRSSAFDDRLVDRDRSAFDELESSVELEPIDVALAFELLVDELVDEMVDDSLIGDRRESLSISLTLLDESADRNAQVEVAEVA